MGSWYEGVQVSFCHVVVCRVHIFWQAHLLGDEGHAQENSAVTSLHGGQDALRWSYDSHVIYHRGRTSTGIT